LISRNSWASAIFQVGTAFCEPFSPSINRLPLFVFTIFFSSIRKKKSSGADFAVALITFVFTASLGSEDGLLVGAGAALLVHLYGSTRPEIVEWHACQGDLKVLHVARGIDAFNAAHVADRAMAREDTGNPSLPPPAASRLLSTVSFLPRAKALVIVAPRMERDATVAWALDGVCSAGIKVAVVVKRPSEKWRDPDISKLLDGPSMDASLEVPCAGIRGSSPNEQLEREPGWSASEGPPAGFDVTRVSTMRQDLAVKIVPLKDQKWVQASSLSEVVSWVQNDTWPASESEIQASAAVPKPSFWRRLTGSRRNDNAQQPLKSEESESIVDEKSPLICTTP
jgi:hypothetical protein